MEHLLNILFPHHSFPSVFIFALLIVHSSYPIGVGAFVVVDATESISSTGVFSVPFANKRGVSMKMRMEESSPKEFELDIDTSEFHQYAAASVDLGLGHVSSGLVLSVLRSVRNWELNTRQNYLYRFDLNAILSRSSNDTETIDDNMHLPPIPLDSSVQMYLPSPSGRKTVVIKTEKKDGTDSDEQVVEVWQGPSLIHRIQVGGKGIHGKLINDPAGFGIPTWSPDEEYLLYSAERLSPSVVPFWINTEKNSTTEEKHRGGTNVVGHGRSENWGEVYHAQEAILDLYILNLSTGRLGRVENTPQVFDETKPVKAESTIYTLSSITLGQAVWHPKSSKIAFTGWSAGQPKRLGMVYCKNRASRIYVSEVGPLLLDLAKTDGVVEKDTIGEDEAGRSANRSFTCVSSDLHFSRSPRFVQGADGNENILFLGSDRAFVSHDACIGLYRWDERKQVTENVVPIIERPSTKGSTVSGLGFPGLFLGQLPLNCNLGSNYVITNSLWGSFQRLIRIDIRDGKIELVDIPQLNSLASHSICTVGPNGDIVISESSCDQPASLWFVKNSDLMQETSNGCNTITVNAHRVASFAPIAASTYSRVDQRTEKAFRMQVLSIDSEHIDGAPSCPIQALLLLPKRAEQDVKIPIIVVPHGGPHGCSASAFAPGIAYLASKYAVLLPNYRGSTGFGQAPLSSLLTRIGRVDVEDVMLCTRYAVEHFGVVDGQRVGICGGSHGGFLTAHCTSQYPDFFKAAAMRNPVTNIASMFTSTDIPDWCLGETMGEYDQSLFRSPTSDQLVRMYEKSPVSRVHQVKTPTLIALGLADLRVPPSQGLEWFHSLRSLGVPAKLLKYPHDCHSLNIVTTEADHWIHIRHWFDHYL